MSEKKEQPLQEPEENQEPVEAVFMSKTLFLEPLLNDKDFPGQFSIIPLSPEQDKGKGPVFEKEKRRDGNGVE